MAQLSHDLDRIGLEAVLVWQGRLKFRMHVSIVASSPPSQTDAFQWSDESDCQVMAERLAEGLRPVLTQGQTVYIELHGTLGAGKTTFTRHLLRALGVEGRIKSPSYAVVEPHEAPGIQIHHFDFYRFNDPQEWEDAGFRDLFAAPGLKLAEWPEQAAGLLPRPDLRLSLTPVSDTRRDVRLQALTPTGEALRQRIAQP